MKDRCVVVTACVLVITFAMPISAQSTPRSASLTGVGRIDPSNVRAVQFSIYNAVLPICAQNGGCTFPGSNSSSRPQLWNIELPIAADQEILTVDYQVAKFGDLAKFDHLRVARLDSKHIQLEIAAHGNAKADVEIAVLLATIHDVVAEIVRLAEGLRIAKQDIDDLRRELRAVDEGKGLVRTAREKLTFANGVISPAPRAFTDRGPIAAIVQPVLGSSSFIIFNGGNLVQFGGCLNFSMTGRLNIERTPGPCEAGAFDVLYLFSGPPFPP